MTDLQPGADPRSCFGSVADAYDRGRPSYPTQAAAWLVGEQPATVLELGAGTGKLTEVLVGLGHEVHATDPDAAMLERLRARLPLVRASVAGAEDIPLGDGSVDVVVAGQAFHWFDMERALPEINRVLRPGGHLALVWNQRDERVPWVRRLGALLGDQDQRTDLADPLEHSGLFGWVEEETFKHRQVIDRESVLDLALSRSTIATLDEHRREAKLAEVRATGLAINDEELASGLRSLAVPVRDHTGTVVAAVGTAVHLSGWNATLDAVVARLEPALRRSAGEISQRLGWLG